MTIKAELLTYTDWRIAAYAARTCYDSHSKSDYESDYNLLINCINRGHESVIEHISMTWKLEMSRSTSHQLVRHRMASISQQSQRYVKLNTQDEWYTLPKSLEGDTETHHLLQLIGKFYSDRLTEGVKPEDARELLPNCTNTVMVFTCNMRSFRNIVKLRTSKHAQEPIRNLVNSMLASLPKELNLLATTLNAKDALLYQLSEVDWDSFGDEESERGFLKSLSIKAKKLLE